MEMRVILALVCNFPEVRNHPISVIGTMLVAHIDSQASGIYEYRR